MSENNTEIHAIDGTDYQLRRRLGWYEQDYVDSRSFRLYTSGEALKGADGLDDLKEVEIVMNTAEHTKARLEHRLVGMNRKDIRKIPPPHVAVLVDIIQAYEDEQEKETEALKAGNPTGTPSSG